MFKYVYVEVSKIVLKLMLGGYSEEERGQRHEMQHRKGCSKGTASEQSFFCSAFVFPSTTSTQSCCNTQSVSLLLGRLVSRTISTPALKLSAASSRFGCPLCLPLAFIFF